MGRYHVGFIGAGNMGEPFLGAAVRLFGKEKVTFYIRTEERRAELEVRYGIQASPNNAELAAESDIIFLCVKPQFFDGVLDEIRPACQESSKTVVSIAAGLSIATIATGLNASAKIVRIMPNMPAAVGAGMSTICFGEGAEPEKNMESAEVVKLINMLGMSEAVPERLMDAATCAAGSSPAYVYMFIEALADSAVKYGIPRATAYRLAAQTVKGSAELLLQTGEHPAVLKDKICSPGGTTIEGVAALEEAGFRNAVLKATDACFEKSVKLGKKN